MPTSSHPAPHSAVLSLSFALLQEAVQRHLLPNGRPLTLTFASADQQQHYRASLSHCSVQPAPDNQCALVFQFDRLDVTTPRYQVGASQVELTCLASLVVQPLDGETEAGLAFDCLLVPEGELRNVASLHPLWAEYPRLNQETKLALLPELEAVVYSRLRFNLCQVRDQVPAGAAVLVSAGATLLDVAVVGGLSPHLELYFADADSYRYGPSGGAVPTLPTVDEILPTIKKTSAGLLIGNEHLLRTLLLPSFQHLFEDYINHRPGGEVPAAPIRFAQLFQLEPAADHDALALPGTLRATNTVVLLPRYTGPLPETGAGISHTVNPGDLVITMDDQVRVSIIYTLGLDPDAAKPPEAVIKIRQHYAFRLLLGSSPFELLLERSELDVWGEATQPAGVFERFKDQLTHVARQYVVQRAMADLFGLALRYLTQAPQPRLRRGLSALPSTGFDGSLLPDAPLAEVSLAFYPVASVHPFATTLVPPALTKQPPLAAAAPATGTSRKRTAQAAGSTPAALAASPVTEGAPVSQVLAIQVQYSTAVANLNRLLVELRSTENALDYFYSTSLRELMLGAWRVSEPVTGLLYDYALDFASQFWMMGAYLKQHLLRYSGIDSTADALLVRMFYGPTYATDALRYDQTRAGLERALAQAVLPGLLTHQHTNLVAIEHKPAGLWLQFSVDISKLSVSARPIVRCPAAQQPPPSERIAKATEAQQRAAARAEVQFEQEWLAFDASFNDFFDSVAPDEPSAEIAQLAKEYELTQVAERPISRSGQGRVRKQTGQF